MEKLPERPEIFADLEALPAELFKPASPRIVLSSKDLRTLGDLEPLLKDWEEPQVSIIDIDVYQTQIQQQLALEKARAGQEQLANETSYARASAWVDSIFLKALNAAVFAAGFYLTTHENVLNGNFLLGCALYPLGKGYGTHLADLAQPGTITKQRRSLVALLLVAVSAGLLGVNRSGFVQTDWINGAAVLAGLLAIAGLDLIGETNQTSR